METDGRDLILWTTPENSLEIKLESGPLHGARWRFAPPNEGVTLYESGARLIGAGAGAMMQQSFAFETARVGSHVLVFELKRPADPAVRRRQRVIVQVREFPRG